MANPPYKEFILRRLHSLTGIIPLGIFLFEHFFTNSFAHQGPEAYNEKAHFLRNLPFITFLEWGGVFIPFAFHGFYGMYLIVKNKPMAAIAGTSQNNYLRNWLYVFQRLTGVVALGFIIFHLWTLRFSGAAEPGVDVYALTVRSLQNPAVFWFYIIGVVGVVFHFANGLSTFCMTWGLTVGPTSQKLVGLGCVGMGVALTAAGIWAVLGFTGDAANAHVAAEAGRALSAVWDAGRMISA